MNWNEQDPWKKKSSENGPPDLDALIRGFFDKKTSSPPSSGGFGANFLGMIFAVVAVFYVVTGFYVVRQPEKAVILRLGKFYSVKESGLNWFPRFIDQVLIVNMDEIGTFKKENLMLSMDENIVHLSIAVQFRKNDATKFLFADENPVGTLEQLAESSIRSVIGHTNLDNILTVGKFKITQDVNKIIDNALKNYEIGLELVDVNLNFARPPIQVQQSFNDVTKAREDEQATINDAKRYNDSQLPIVQGHAQRVRDDARAYKEAAVLKAKGQTQRFNLLLSAYQDAPDLMKERMYFETVEKILSSTSKILVDSKINAPFMYLPLDVAKKLQKNNQQESQQSLTDQNDKNGDSLSYRNSDEDRTPIANSGKKKIQIAAPLVSRMENKS